MASFGPRSASLNIRGVEPEDFELRGVTLADGRAHLARGRHAAPARRGDRSDRAEALLGAKASGTGCAIGGTPFRVVGLLARVGTQLARDGPLIDEQVWVPIGDSSGALAQPAASPTTS